MKYIIYNISKFVKDEGMCLLGRRSSGVAAGGISLDEVKTHIGVVSLIFYSPFVKTTISSVYYLLSVANLVVTVSL